MGHKPTIFYILENETLGTWWVGKMESTLDEYGMCPYKSISQGELNTKLGEKYYYTTPYLTLVTLNKRWNACYGVERWLSKLEYKINKEPERYRELKDLLMAGWEDGETETSTLSVLHVLEHNQPINKIFKKLVTSREGLTRCLNDTKYITYEEKKKDPTFMYQRSRKEVLRQMEKTKKLPKPSTLDKYQIKEDEIKECMGPTGIIYKIASPSGKVYIGQTVHSLEDRIKGHKKKSTNCTLVKRAIDKYDNQMKYEIIEEVSHQQLDEREIYWINHFNSLAPNGYNCSAGGNNKKVLTQVLKDNIRDGMNANKIKRDGYLGGIIGKGPFRPIARLYGTKTYLSESSFNTREEAIEVLKEYTRDPSNFTKIDNTNKRPKGCVYKRSNKWVSIYKHKYIGSFDTEEEAREGIAKFNEEEILQSG